MKIIKDAETSDLICMRPKPEIHSRICFPDHQKNSTLPYVQLKVLCIFFFASFSNIGAEVNIYHETEEFY